MNAAKIWIRIRIWIRIWIRLSIQLLIIQLFSKVMATKVYTSAEFKRERDNFLSLCKNLERAETKKWLSEVF